MNNAEWTPDRIRAVRLAYNWTLQQAAEAIGVERRAWQRWEQPSDTPGNRTPRGPAIRALAELEKNVGRAALARARAEASDR